MQQNYPYPGPQYGGVPTGPPFGSDPGRARSMVQAPAIGLIVIGILGVLGQLGSIAMNLLGAGMGAMGAAGGDEAIFQLFSGVVGLVLGGLWLVLYGVVIFGGVKMKSLESYPLAMTSSILALLPCSFCCVLTMPIGIWSLVILLNQDVKAAFR